MRKETDDLETVTQDTINAYMERVSIAEEELKSMFDAESWVSAESAMQMGFATSIMQEEPAGQVTRSLQPTSNRGSKGDNIRWVQWHLKRLGLYRTLLRMDGRIPTGP